MLYLLKQNSRGEDDWLSKETVIGIYESRELANKEIENIVEKHIKEAASYNQKMKLHECINCDDFACDYRCDCTECFTRIERTDDGFKEITWYAPISYRYSVEGFELNKGLY